MLLLLWLKLKSLLNHPSVLLVLLVLPLLLLYLAGATELANDATQLKVALVDQAANPAAALLAQSLEDGAISWLQLSAAAAEKALGKGELSAILLIKPGFTLAELPRLERLALYCAGRAELATVVKEELAIALLPQLIIKDLSSDLTQIAVNYDRDPAQIPALFEAALLRTQQRVSPIELKIAGVATSKRKLVYLPNFRVEILFLSLFAIMGTLALPKPVLRRRLLALPWAFAKDYLLSVLALFLLGCLQLAVMRFFASLFFATAVAQGNLLVFLAYLLLMLALSQVFLLLHADSRLTVATITVLMLAVLGGCFFPLPASWLHRIGIYTPQGWALANLEQASKVGPSSIAILALLILALVGFLQKKQLRG